MWKIKMTIAMQEILGLNPKNEANIYVIQNSRDRAQNRHDYKTLLDSDDDMSKYIQSRYTFNLILIISG